MPSESAISELQLTSCKTVHSQQITMQPISSPKCSSHSHCEQRFAPCRLASNPLIFHTPLVLRDSNAKAAKHTHHDILWNPGADQCLADFRQASAKGSREDLANIPTLKPGTWLRVCLFWAMANAVMIWLMASLTTLSSHDQYIRPD